ncbi:Flp pilus assembly protein TadG [Sphingomonas insulae]|uniref:TadE-like domain-containing protein n=1 Tax=Sphingomonas insulae TaxID=424800 RepID=A0ABP3STW9_9SPHN|nr:TadE/TadG family type IV pilus assembly protein [Sphingomonas insulae]NIJ31591.1 Flp pilus assembly protein TadG [Sphingomonas insulae]
MTRLFARLRRDRAGIALTEFAITFPVLLLLFLGGYQVSDAIACKRKVGLTNRTIADLGTRRKSVSAADVDAMLAAATQVMSPYRETRARIRLTEVLTDSTGKTTVVWSRGRNTVARTAGSVVSLPTPLRSSGNYLLLSEITYGYDPGVRFGVIGPQTLSDLLFMSPRNSVSVPCNGC